MERKVAATTTLMLIALALTRWSAPPLETFFAALTVAAAAAFVASAGRSRGAAVRLWRAPHQRPAAHHRRQAR